MGTAFHLLSLIFYGFYLPAPMTVSDSYSRPSFESSAVKVYVWDDINIGHCSQAEIRLEVHSDGTASLQSKVWTDDSDVHRAERIASSIHLIPDIGSGHAERFLVSEQDSDHSVSLISLFRFPKDRFAFISNANQHLECEAVERLY